MLSTKTKKQLRNIALGGIFATFVLLYLGPVTFDNGAITIAGLVIGAITAVISWLAF